MRTTEISLEEARELGFVIDFPAHPAGEGAPTSSRPDGRCDGARQFEAFRLDETIPTRAGFLVRLGGAHLVPAFVAGLDRAGALAEKNAAR